MAADSTEPRKCGYPPRPSLLREGVRMNLLIHSKTSTPSPFQSHARDFPFGDHADGGWRYERLLKGREAIAERLALMVGNEGLS